MSGTFSRIYQPAISRPLERTLKVRLIITSGRYHKHSSKSLVLKMQISATQQTQKILPSSCISADGCQFCLISVQLLSYFSRLKKRLSTSTHAFSGHFVTLFCLSK